MKKRLNIYWKDYPELTSCVRTEKEDQLANKITNLKSELWNYASKYNLIGLMGDIQGGVHLLQIILIRIQKQRLNNRRRVPK